MGLTVLSVAYPLAPVGPDAVGGAEQVLTALDAALVRAGHRSLVVACEGSVCAGELVPTPLPRGPLDAAREEAWRHHRAAIEAVIARERVDLVHLHGVDFEHYVPSAGPPVLVTLHLPPEFYRPEAFAPSRLDVFFHCVSASQRARCPELPRLLESIPNGVDLAHFRPGGAHDGPALLLGRLCPEKGVHLAIEAARRARLPLEIAGQVFRYPSHERYFAEEVAPRLDEHRRFVGPLGRVEKAERLRRARCLVIPSLVEETSSLVAMEALASGTPVVAFRRGALAEVVEHGVTGLLVSDEAELAEALKDIAAIDPARCRAAAEARFSEEAMCRRYLATFERLARAPRVPRHAPVRVEPIRTVEALEALRAEWRELWSRSPSATAFQRPEWLLPHVRTLFSGEVLSLAFRRTGRLVGLLPAHRWWREDEGVLSLLGGGVSDWLDVLVEPEAEAEVAAALEAFLQDAELVDAVELSELPPDSPLLRLAWPAPFTVDVAAQGVCPALVVPEGQPSGLAALPKRLQGNLRTAWRRLEAMGTPTFERATPASVDELLDALFVLHGARWKERGGGGVLADARVQRFHREVARGFLADDSLELHGLRLDGERVAVFYGLRDRTALRYYLSGFEPAFAKASVGALVVAHAFDDAVRRGVRTLDFLRGAEPYKYAWGAVDRPQYRLEASTPSHRAGAAAVEIPA